VEDKSMAAKPLADIFDTILAGKRPTRQEQQPAPLLVINGSNNRIVIRGSTLTVEHTRLQRRKANAEDL
jgi:hypothetical protein